MAGDVTFDNDLEILENCSHQNGSRYWMAREFMENLGYSSWHQAKSVINRAIASCARLDLDVAEAFQACEETYRGDTVASYKLNRFACFLIVTHADDKKPQVQKAKVALSALAEVLIQASIDSNSILRVDTRGELKEAEKIMGAAAKQAGVQSADFGIFKDAGFRGMYNMSLSELRRYKGVIDNGKSAPVLYDYMGITELAGNLFRVTQTSERIRSQNISGLSNATRSAKQVGAEVREMMYRNSGIHPEDLPIEDDIKKVKSTLKKVNRNMVKHDQSKK